MTFTPPSGPPSSPPPHPSGDEPGEPASGSRRRPLPLGLVVAVAAVLGAALVLGVLVLLDRDGDELATPGVTTTTAPTTTGPTTTEAAPPTTGEGSSSTAPGTTPDSDPVEPVACPEGIPAPICEAADFVQTEAGRAFRQFPEVELLDGEAFEERRRAIVEEEGTEDIEAAGRTLTALGLLPPGLDVVATLEELNEAAVAGFYNVRDDELVVRGTEFSPLTRAVLVHELVHALDDQWFELHRPEYDELDSEAGFGFLAVTEGHARVIENRFRQSLPPDQQGDAAREELRLLVESGIDILSIPPILLESLTAPYVLGERLVQAILGSGGQEALAAAYAEPPRTSEQVLHPEAYFAGEPRVELPDPPADGAVIDSDVLGELGLQWWLDSPRQAQGWGGDRYVTWEMADGVCTRVDVVMDSPAELDEARAGFAEWAAADDGRRVEGVEVAGRPALRVTGCAG